MSLVKAATLRFYYAIGSEKKIAHTKLCLPFYWPPKIARREGVRRESTAEINLWIIQDLQKANIKPLSLESP